MTSLLRAVQDCTASGFHASTVSGPVWLCVLALVFAVAFWPGSAFGGESRSGRVREPVLAGSWYEGGSAALADSVDARLTGKERPHVPVSDAKKEAYQLAAEGRHPVALVVPHAGHIYSGACAGQAFELLRGAPYRRVILLGPSHYVGFYGAALPEEDAFKTPLGTIPLDREAIQKLAKVDGFQINPQAHAREHSVEIELPFLQRVLSPDFVLIPIVVGRLTPESIVSIGHALADLWNDNTVLIASSDFTHYGPNFDYIPFSSDVPEHLRKLDLGAAVRIERMDLPGFTSYRDSTGATICGAEPIRILLEAAQGRRLTGKMIDYYRSGDLTGDFENSVSYCSIAFFPESTGRRKGIDHHHSGDMSGENSVSYNSVAFTPQSPVHRDLNAAEQTALLRLARTTVQALVNRRPLPSAHLPAETAADSPLREERGVFVTLTDSSGALRGCIGSIVADRPLYNGVIQNAVSAAIRDPRFPPVQADEEPTLEIEISVLTPLRPVNGPQDIVIGRDGVVLEKDGYRSVFLPQVAPEQGWDVATMLSHLALKAGLGPNDWKSGATFETFQAQVFREQRPSSAR